MRVEKHAYLLIVHEYNYVLEILLKCLDHEKNDIYIHVDKKTEKFPFGELKKYLKKSKLIFIPRIKVYWGGYSQIKVELELLKNARKNYKYLYYHLLSGNDLVLKSPNEVHTFFKENYGKEFIGIEQKKFKYDFRIRYYHSEKLTSKRNQTKYLRKIFQIIFIFFQKLFLVKRNRNIEFFKGCNWFSITNNFVEYVLMKEKKIEQIFKYTFCSDEIFLQTLIMNSRFKNKIYNLGINDDNRAAMRYIDWERGFPYILKKEDFTILIESSMIFARKFSEKVDKEIIEMIYQKIINQASKLEKKNK